MSDRYKNYLHDVGSEIVDLAKEAKKRSLERANDYERGRLFSHYEILDLMRQQAATFDIELRDVGLEGVEIGQFLAPD
jgi:hypothetical protein